MWSSTFLPSCPPTFLKMPTQLPQKNCSPNFLNGSFPVDLLLCSAKHLCLSKCFLSLFQTSLAQQFNIQYSLFGRPDRSLLNAPLFFTHNASHNTHNSGWNFWHWHRMWCMWQIWGMVGIVISEPYLTKMSLQVNDSYNYHRGCQAGTGGLKNNLWGPCTNIWGTGIVAATARHELDVSFSWNTFEVRSKLHLRCCKLPTTWHEYY